MLSWITQNVPKLATNMSDKYLERDNELNEAKCIFIYEQTARHIFQIENYLNSLYFSL